ncbi:MAG: chemotaxis response regulator protein-glutamate methylesterase [Oscillospiraceae bacterium]|nr:chemotaxis response regulator protein-glutamate methylesterase [Oscillospiraceae bacterium]
MLDKKEIRVLVVDDSSFFRNLITRGLEKFGNIKVVGEAVDAFYAKKKIKELAPDVVSLDIEMPGMDGIEFLKSMSPGEMLPVVLVSSLNISVFDALSAGAVDFVRKPDEQSQVFLDSFFKELHRKIMIASKANTKIKKPIPAAESIKKIESIQSRGVLDSPKLDSLVIAIGASTGGTEATLAVLKRLPANMPGIVVVQHMPPGFTKMYADRLNGICAMEVAEAKSGDLVKRGKVLIAPGNLQMRLVKMGSGYSVKVTPGEKVSGHCPSVDVLFHSVAAQAGTNAIGVIMTGMGSDGADGLLEMRKKGAFTIGQDRESSVVYGMPMVAHEKGAVTVQASISTMPDILMNRITKHGK